MVTLMESRLPQILAVGILQLANRTDGGVVENPHRILTVGSLDAVVEVDDLISSDGLLAGSSHADFCTASSIQNTSRLLIAVTDNECLLFLCTDTAGELFLEIFLQIEGGVVQKLLGNLDDRTDLVCIDLLLAEYIIAVTVGTALIDPVGRTLGTDHRNLVDTVGSGEHMGERTDGAFLFHAGNQSVLKLIGNQIAALGVNTLGQGISHFIGNTVLGTNLSPECLGVGIGCTADLGVRLLGVFRFLGDRRGNGSSHLTLHRIQTLLAFDLLAQVHDVLLQTLVNLDILFGEDALLVTVGSQESLCLVPSLSTFCTQFIDLAHSKNPP